jgi:hypothetical protein
MSFICQSIKCSECGKVFKNTALANFHAEKSGHDQFEESTDEVRLLTQVVTLMPRCFKIKPLTEEEKTQKLTELRDKMGEKRTKKAAEEAKEAKANELIRRKAGKVRTIPTFLQTATDTAHHRQESAQIKEDMKNKQILKDLDAKRRGSCFRPVPSIIKKLTRRKIPSFRKGGREEGPRCDQGTDRSRQAGARAEGGRGKGATRGCLSCCFCLSARRGSSDGFGTRT